MNTTDYPEIQSLPQFERLVQPKSTTELLCLRQEILSNTSAREIHTWRGNHLNDKERFDCCKAANIPVSIKEVFFNSWLEAAIFICSSELTSCTISDEYRKYLIGQNFYYRVQLEEKTNKRGVRFTIATEIAHEQYLSAGTVMKYNLFSEAMNQVFDQSLDLGHMILTNKVRISHDNVIELSRLKPEEIKTIADSVITDKIDHITLAYIRSEVKNRYISPKKPSERKEFHKKITEESNPAIRKMPEYNPDAEVNSLCMTIDSWISSIQRVSNSENFQKITSKASLHLMKKLSFLEHTINTVQESLVERTNR